MYADNLWYNLYPNSHRKLIFLRLYRTYLRGEPILYHVGTHKFASHAIHKAGHRMHGCLQRHHQWARSKSPTCPWIGGRHSYIGSHPKLYILICCVIQISCLWEVCRVYEPGTAQPLKYSRGMKYFFDLMEFLWFFWFFFFFEDSRTRQSVGFVRMYFEKSYQKLHYNEDNFQFLSCHH